MMRALRPLNANHIHTYFSVCPFSSVSPTAYRAGMVSSWGVTRRDEVSATGADWELWMRLVDLVANRPALAPVAEPTDPDSLRIARSPIAQTMDAMHGFVRDVHGLLATPHTPSAEAIGAHTVESVVRLCRTFLDHWSYVGLQTAEDVRQFNRDEELVAAALNSIILRQCVPAD